MEFERTAIRLRQRLGLAVDWEVRDEVVGVRESEERRTRHWLWTGAELVRRMSLARAASRLKAKLASDVIQVAVRLASRPEDETLRAFLRAEIQGRTSKRMNTITDAVCEPVGVPAPLPILAQGVKAWEILLQSPRCGEAPVDLLVSENRVAYGLYRRDLLRANVVVKKVTAAGDETVLRMAWPAWTHRDGPEKCVLRGELLAGDLLIDCALAIRENQPMRSSWDGDVRPLEAGALDMRAVRRDFAAGWFEEELRRLRRW